MNCAYTSEERDGEEPVERLGDRKSRRVDRAPNGTERSSSRNP